MNAARAPPPSCNDLWRLAGLALLLLPCKFLVDLASSKSFTTPEAARRLSAGHSNPALPDALRGVIWMAGNPGPELLMTLEAGSVDPRTRTVSLPVGVPFSWSYNRDKAGILEYFLVTLSWTLFKAGTLEFQFDEELWVGASIGEEASVRGEEWRTAVLPLKVYGRAIASWYFKRDDEAGERFTRGKLIAGPAGKTRERPVYTALKVIDHLGRRLPAFSTMVAAGRDGTAVQDIPGILFWNISLASRAKTYVQLVRTPFSWPAAAVLLIVLLAYGTCCAACLFRSDWWAIMNQYSRISVEPPHALLSAEGGYPRPSPWS